MRYDASLLSAVNVLWRVVTKVQDHVPPMTFFTPEASLYEVNAINANADPQKVKSRHQEHTRLTDKKVGAVSSFIIRARQR